MGKYIFLFFIFLFYSDKYFAQYEVVKAFPDLSFSNPVDFQNSGDGTNRIFVVEQAGIIKVFQNNPGASSEKVFLDIRDRVASGGEMGLLGLAFHPGYSQNGFFLCRLYFNKSKQAYCCCKI